MSLIQKPMLITSWVLQVVVAIILAQTLFFKFTGAEETKALFEVLGAEDGKLRAVARHVHAFVELEKMRPTSFPPSLLAGLQTIGLVE